MEQKEEDKSTGLGCLAKLDLWKSVIAILVLLVCWGYYGDWDKAFAKWSDGVSEFVTTILGVIGVIVALVAIALLFAFWTIYSISSKRVRKTRSDSCDCRRKTVIVRSA